MLRRSVPCKRRRFPGKQGDGSGRVHRSLDRERAGRLMSSVGSSVQQVEQNRNVVQTCQMAALARVAEADSLALARIRSVGRQRAPKPAALHLPLEGTQRRTTRPAPFLEGEDQFCVQDSRTSRRWMAMAAATPSAQAKVMLCDARAMSPAAYMPWTVVIIMSSTVIKCPFGPF